MKYNMDPEYLIFLLESNRIYINNPTRQLTLKEQLKVTKVLSRYGMINSPKQSTVNPKALLATILSTLVFIGLGIALAYFENSSGAYSDVTTDYSKAYLTSVTTPSQITQPELTSSSSDKGSSRTLTYKWQYNNRDWSYTLTIPDSNYRIYNKVQRNFDYAEYVTEQSDDEYIAALTKEFVESGKKAGYSNTQLIEFIAAFVQHMDYIEDKPSTGYIEYPKYPIETLYDKGGDCEDTSILLAAMLKSINIDTALLEFEDHMAVGIKDNGKMTGTYFLYNNVKYYFIETTNIGWKIGVITPESKREKAEVIPV